MTNQFSSFTQSIKDHSFKFFEKKLVVRQYHEELLKQYSSDAIHTKLFSLKKTGELDFLEYYEPLEKMLFKFKANFPELLNLIEMIEEYIQDVRSSSHLTSERFQKVEADYLSVVELLTNQMFENITSETRSEKELVALFKSLLKVLC